MSTVYPGLTAPAPPIHRQIGAGLRALLFLIAALGTLWGQEVSASTAAPPRGLAVYGLSGYAVYYSSSFPEGSLPTVGTTLPSDVGAGGSVQLGWTRVGEKSRVVFMYTPSYTGRVRLSAWNALNHSLNLNAARKFGRWDFGFSLASDLSNLAEFLFSPTVFSSVAAVSVSFDDLASAMLAGKYTNAQLASILTGAPIVESPARNLFYGERMFTTALRATLSYAPSPRVSIAFSANGTRDQHLSDTAAGVTQDAYLIPRTTSAGAGVSVSYSQSPRTQWGVSMGSNRISSSIQDAYSSSAALSLGRTMGRRWFLQLSGGLGVIKPLRSTFLLNTSPQPVMNASLGVHIHSHTIIGSYGRSVSDSYGLGANNTNSASGTWKWHKPGRGWWMDSTLSWQQLSGSAFANISGWRVENRYGRALGSHTALIAQYVYLRYSQQLASIPALTQNAVRVSLVWNPQPHAFQ